jgi:hypothetical protein
MSDDALSPAGHRERLRARLLASGGDSFHDYELSNISSRWPFRGRTPSRWPSG